MSKQTAVEWLVEKYELVGVLTLPMIERAKAMEREQIIDAHGLKYYDLKEEIISGEQYYHETYKGGEQ